MSEIGKMALIALKQLGGWLAFVIGMFVALVLLSRSCAREADAQALFERAEEKHELEKAGLEVVHGAKQAALEIQLQAAREQSAEFAAALDEAMAKMTKARPVFVARASTGPVKVRPPESTGGHEGDGACGGKRSVSGAPSSQCLLRVGDTGQIDVTEAVLESGKGNRVLVGSAEAYRIDDGARSLLFGGRFQTDVTIASEELRAPERPPGWILSALGGVILTKDGLTPAVGGSAVSPPFLFGHLSATAHVAGGPGAGVVMGGFSYR